MNEVCRNGHKRIKSNTYLYKATRTCLDCKKISALKRKKSGYYKSEKFKLSQKNWYQKKKAKLLGFTK